MKPKTNLDLLKQPFNFPTHPQDGIKNVKITMMRLKSYNSECDIMLKIPMNGNRNIHDIVAQQVDDRSSIVNSLVVKEAKLNIEFHNQNHQADDNLSLINIQSSGKYELINPNSKNITTIINKYLKYWRLVNEFCN